MQRITTATRFVDKFGPGKDGFNDGNDTTGVSSTQLDAAAFDNYQEEIANAIELSGIPLDPTDMTQLHQAIRAEIAAAVPPPPDLTPYVLKAGDVMTGGLTAPYLGALGVGSEISVGADTNNRWIMAADPTAGSFAAAQLVGGVLGPIAFSVDNQNNFSVAGDIVSANNIYAGGAPKPLAWNALLFGSGLSINASSGGAGFNVYAVGPNTWNYTANGSAGLMNFSSGTNNFVWEIAPFGGQDTVAPLAQAMSLSATGVLVVPGQLRGSSVSFDHTQQYVASFDGQNCRIDYADGISNFVWRLSDGFSAWNGPNGATMGLDNLGNLTLFIGNGFKALNGDLWNVASDLRIKRDVADYTAGLDRVCALRPISFRYNGEGGTPDNGQIEYGLIAQEAQTVMPEMVFNMDVPQFNLDGTQKPRASNMLPGQLGMNRSALIYALVNAVRELAARMTAAGV